MGNARAADAIAISLGVGVAVSVNRRAPKSNAAGIVSDLSSSLVSLVSIETPFDVINDRVVVRLVVTNLPRDALLDDDRARSTASRARGITARMQMIRCASFTREARVDSGREEIARRETNASIDRDRDRGRDCDDARRGKASMMGRDVIASHRTRVP
jgi:hypothetical protein|tara:strand:- start:60 stop:533 length:474 start_codon:yes stop_codon:yes gene_type:complete